MSQENEDNDTEDTPPPPVFVPPVPTAYVPPVSFSNLSAVPLSSDGDDQPFSASDPASISAAARAANQLANTDIHIPRVPFVDNVIQTFSVGSDLFQGNYGDAAVSTVSLGAGAGTAALLVAAGVSSPLVTLGSFGISVTTAAVLDSPLGDAVQNLIGDSGPPFTFTAPGGGYYLYTADQEWFHVHHSPGGARTGAVVTDQLDADTVTNNGLDWLLTKSGGVYPAPNGGVYVQEQGTWFHVYSAASTDIGGGLGPGPSTTDRVVKNALDADTLAQLPLQGWSDFEQQTYHTTERRDGETVDIFTFREKGPDDLETRYIRYPSGDAYIEQGDVIVVQQGNSDNLRIVEQWRDQYYANDYNADGTLAANRSWQPISQEEYENSLSGAGNNFTTISEQITGLELEQERQQAIVDRYSGRYFNPADGESSLTLDESNALMAAQWRLREIEQHELPDLRAAYANNSFSAHAGAKYQEVLNQIGEIDSEISRLQRRLEDAYGPRERGSLENQIEALEARKKPFDEQRESLELLLENAAQNNTATAEAPHPSNAGNPHSDAPPTVTDADQNGSDEEGNGNASDPGENQNDTSTYQLQDGDTLSQIAADNGTTVEALLAANPQITDPNAIRAGDTLVIPTQENTSPTESDQHSDTPYYNNAGNPHSDDQAAATNGQDVSGTESAIAGGYSSGGEGEFAGTPIDGLPVYDNEDQLDDSPYVASPDATPEDLANDDYDPDYDAYTDQGDSSSSYSSPGNPHYDAGDVLAEHNQAQGIGSSIATGIDNLINANNNLNDFERFALSTVLQTGTQNIISESYSDLAETMSVEEITGFEDFFDDLGSTALNVGAGMLTGAITADLVSELGWNEEWSAVAGSALNVGVGAVVDSFIAEGVGAISSVGDTFTGAYSASGIGNIGTNIVVNIATSELMESLGIGQTKTGALFATIGSIIGQIFIPIPFLGAAIGQVIGGLIGDLFSSPPPPPQAEITLSFNADTEEYEQTGGWGEHGGNPASLTGGGEHLSAMVEQYQLLLESYGGQLANRHELPDVVLGFRGNEQYIMVNGEQVGTMSEHGFKSATGSLLNEMVIEGGNSYLNHVLYSDVPPAELGDLLSSAQQRILYDNNPASKGVIDALLAEQSETMQRYDELSARQAQLESEIGHLEIEINRLSNPPRVNVDKGEWVEGEISPASHAAIARYSASLAEAHEELTNVEAGLLSLLDVEAIDAAQATLRDLHEQLEAYGQEAEISTLSADDLHALATIEGQINSTQIVLETAGASLQQAQHWHSVLAQTAPYQDMLNSEHELDDATRLDYELSYLNGIRSQNDEAQFSLHDTDLSDLVLVRDGDALTVYNRRGFDIDTPLDALPAMTFDDFGQWTNDRINLTFTNGDGEVVETSFFIGQLFDVAEQVNDGEPVDTLDMAVIVAGLYGDYLGAQMTPDEALALHFGGLGSIDTAGSRQGGAGDELLFAYSGAVYAGGGNDVVVANEAANSIDGGSGEDVVSYLHSEEGVNVNLASGDGQGGHAEGDTYANLLWGSEGSDTLRAEGGNNIYYMGRRRKLPLINEIDIYSFKQVA